MSEKDDFEAPLAADVQALTMTLEKAHPGGATGRLSAVSPVAPPSSLHPMNHLHCCCRLSSLPLLLMAGLHARAAEFIVPTAGTTAYRQFSDSPFASVDFSSDYFHLETFEDDALNTPGASAAGGSIIGIEDWGSLVDSVDIDDGVLDEAGTTGGLGRSYFGGTFTFDFDAAVLGKLPTHAGVVWTDGGGPVTIQAFGPGGVELGSATGVAHADGSVTGTTAEDRFYGVVDAGGISRIILSAGGAQEADHLQYGFAVVSNLSPREQWRQRYFGITSNSGAAADTVDPEGDGLVNLLEFACALDPTKSSIAPVQVERNGDAVTFTYTRSKAALSDGVVFFVEWSDDLKAGSWTSDETTFRVVEENELIQIIQATVPPSPHGQRFLRLRIEG
jgi:hypothetical protein